MESATIQSCPSFSRTVVASTMKFPVALVLTFFGLPGGGLPVADAEDVTAAALSSGLTPA
jgi:hypothetical protein